MYIYLPLQVAYTLQAIFVRNFDTVNHYLYIIGGASILQIIFQSIAAWAHNRNGIYAAIYVQRTVFENYINKDYDFYADQYIGSLGEQAAVLRESASTYSTLMISHLFKHATIIGGGISVLIIKAPILALVTVICMIAILGYTVATSNYRLRFRREVSRASSKLAGVVGDALGHGTTVKSFATEKYEINRLNQSIEEWRIPQLLAWDSFLPANAGRIILNAISLVVLLFVTAHLYMNGEISIAIVVLVQLYMVRLLATTIDIADYIKQYEQVMGTAYRGIKTLDIPQSITDALKTRKMPKIIDDIKLDNLSFVYGKKEALHEVTIHVKKGEKVGIVGYSGSGKSTLSKLLVRFMDPASGSISINGVDIREYSQRELRSTIAYVPQEPLLFHRSIYENIAYGNPSAPRRDVIAAAKMAHIDSYVSELVDAYETTVGERGIKLSGGQRQRVAIARAILKDAPILVLDEATSALDSKSERLIQDALWNLMKDRTAIVIAHRLSTIQHMDRIIVLDKGRLVESGSHQELLKFGGIYAHLWDHQAGGYIES